MKEHTVNAEHKSIGRVASEVAVLLMGKDSTAFQKHLVADVKVRVTNASRVRTHGTKMDKSIHTRYSGYPGGLKQTTWKEVAAKKGYGEIVKVAVRGMLPKNSLRDKMMKRLTVEE